MADDYFKYTNVFELKIKTFVPEVIFFFFRFSGVKCHLIKFDKAGYGNMKTKVKHNIELQGIKDI